MIKALIFDNYGVLMTQIFNSLSSVLPPEVYSKVSNLCNASDSGKIGEAERTNGVIRLLNAYHIDGVKWLADKERTTKINQPLLDIIKSEKGRYKTAILSNASSNVKRLYGNYNLATYFDDIIWSYEVGYIKPAPEIYQLAAQRLGVEPAECVFTDDNPRNIAGAEAVGMHGIVYRDLASFKKRLDEVLNA